MQPGDRLEMHKETLACERKISYPGHLMGWQSELMVIGARWTHTGDFGDFQMTKGDPVLEYFSEDLWYGTIRLMNPRGELRGWYCDICLPPRLDILGSGAELTYTDLALDVFIDPAGNPRVKDRREFESRILPRLSPSSRRRCYDAVQDLLESARRGASPFSRNQIGPLEDSSGELHEPSTGEIAAEVSRYL